MSRIGDYSFSPLARYLAPGRDHSSAPVVFRPGGTRFPSIAFWRSRYGYADRGMQPQSAEWLAQDFQELEAYRFGLCIRVLDYIYDEPFGGTPEEREAVLAELDSLVAAGAILQLRVCVAEPEYRHYRLQFFRDHTATDVGFWLRLALVYARLAGGAAPAAPGPQTSWCHALLEEARVLGCPAFTPELIAALLAAGGSAVADALEISGSSTSNEAPHEPADSAAEIPEEQSPADDSESESSACPDVVIVNTVNTVIPAVILAECQGPPSVLTSPPESIRPPPAICATERDRPEVRHRTPDEGHWLFAAFPTAPHMRSRAMIPTIIHFAAPAPSHCRAPPRRSVAEGVDLPKHRPYPARGPPEELRIKNGEVPPFTDRRPAKPGQVQPEQSFWSRCCLPVRDRQSPTSSPLPTHVAAHDGGARSLTFSVHDHLHTRLTARGNEPRVQM